MSKIAKSAKNALDIQGLGSPTNLSSQSYFGFLCHCERPAYARSPSYGGFEVRRSAEREGGSEAIPLHWRMTWWWRLRRRAFALLAMTDDAALDLRLI